MILMRWQGIRSLDTTVHNTLAATETQLFGIPNVQQGRHCKYHITIGFRSSMPVASLRHHCHRNLSAYNEAQRPVHLSGVLFYAAAADDY